MGQHASRTERMRLAAPKRLRQDAPPQGGEQQRQRQRQRQRPLLHMDDAAPPQDAPPQGGKRQHVPPICSVCHDDLTQAAGNTTLSCRHTLHTACLEKMRSHNLTKCPLCRQQIPRAVLDMWPAIRDPAGWPAGPALISRLRVDDEPAVARAIFLLRGLTLARMDDMNVDTLAYEIAHRIFFSQSVPASRAREEFKFWMLENTEYLGGRLSHGEPIVQNSSYNQPSPEAWQLAQRVLSPLTAPVVNRVAQIIYEAGL